MPDIIPIADLLAPEPDVFARLTEGQLQNGSTPVIPLYAVKIVELHKASR